MDSNKKLILGLMAAGLAIVVAAFFVEWRAPTTSTEIAPREKTLEETSFLETATLKRSNPAFAEGLQKMHTGDLSGALQSFTSALEDADAPLEKGRIQYLIGTAHGLQGAYADSIRELQAVALTPEYGELQNAIALMQIAEFNIRYNNSIVKETTFAHRTFEKYVEPGDEALTIRHMFDDVSRVYPFPLSEARIMIWYVNELLSSVKRGVGINAPEIQIARDQIMERLGRLQAGIVREMERGDPLIQVPTALQQKAIALGKLALLGIASSDEAEETYTAAEKAYRAEWDGKNDPFTSLYHAAYVELQFGNKKADEVHELLGRIVHGGYETTHPIHIFLASSRKTGSDAKGAAVNAWLKKLAARDADFKTYLKSLGWGESDF